MLSSIALRQFAEVARCASLRVAAERLFVAGSAISRQLRLLEKEFGTPLFERGRGKASMRLTPAGEILMALVRSMEAEEERARTAMRALKHPERSIVRMGMPEALTQEFMPSFLADFRRRHPDVDFRVQVATSTRLMELLRDDELDLSLVFSPLMLPGVRAVYERSLTTCILVGDDHPLASRSEVRMEDCIGYPMAVADASMHLMRVTEETFNRAELRPDRALVSNSYELLRAACAAGLALAVLSEPLSRRAAEQRSLRYIPLVDARPRNFTVFVRQGPQLAPSVRGFVDELIGVLRGLEAESRRPRRAAGRSLKGNKPL
ncbi:MAG: LysR family transcriptional regulator [Lautropia sp.]